jgi:hypothetical protein
MPAGDIIALHSGIRNRSCHPADDADQAVKRSHGPVLDLLASPDGFLDLGGSLARNPR